MAWPCTSWRSPAAQQPCCHTLSPRRHILGVHATARSQEAPSSNLELKKRPLGRLTNLIATGPAPTHWAEDERLHASATASSSGSDSPGSLTRGRETSGRAHSQHDGGQAPQSADWQAELLELVTLLPQALRTALLLHEDFLEVLGLAFRPSTTARKRLFGRQVRVCIVTVHLQLSSVALLYVEFCGDRAPCA